MRVVVGIAVPLIALVSCIACGDSDLRGTYKPSGDGNTYLAVVDDNGGHCGPLTVDGKLWRHKIGEAAPIEPGHHTIACGAEIQFDIPRDVVYKFDYWGP
jgi:hypothetical protein